MRTKHLVIIYKVRKVYSFHCVFSGMYLKEPNKTLFNDYLY